MAKQELFRKDFAAFKLCGKLRWADDRQIARAKCIRDAVYEWKFRPNNRKIRPRFFRKRGKGADIARVDCNTLCLCGNPGIAGRTPDFFCKRTFAELPDESVLPATTANYKDFQNLILFP